MFLVRNNFVIHFCNISIKAHKGLKNMTYTKHIPRITDRAFLKNMKKKCN